MTRLVCLQGTSLNDLWLYSRQAGSEGDNRHFFFGHGACRRVRLTSLPWMLLDALNMWERYFQRMLVLVCRSMIINCSIANASKTHKEAAHDVKS